MKILYAIQGTGNGHLSRAIELIPHFMHHGQVDVLLSGIQCELILPFPVKYRFHGLSFIFGKKGGIDFIQTYAKNRVRRFMREVNCLPVSEYDLVISDFEPVSSWACYMAGKPCIGLSNQAALLTEGAPIAEEGDIIGKFILGNYAPVTRAYGFHFEQYNGSIFTPIIRSEVRLLQPENQGHITVYLPAYDDQRIVDRLSEFPDTQWEVYSKHNQRPFEVGSVLVRPIDNRAFLESLRTCAGILCAAGFGAASEALFLGKKLCVVPMKRQFEQQCNAMALSQLGVTIMPSFKHKHLHVLEDWLFDAEPIRVNYPDNGAHIAARIVDENPPHTQVSVPVASMAAKRMALI